MLTANTHVLTEAPRMEEGSTQRLQGDGSDPSQPSARRLAAGGSLSLQRNKQEVKTRLLTKSKAVSHFKKPKSILALKKTHD